MYKVLNSLLRQRKEIPWIYRNFQSVLEYHNQSEALVDGKYECEQNGQSFCTPCRWRQQVLLKH